MPSDDIDTAAIHRWFRCPECGGDEIRLSYNNGRLAVSCEECHAAASKLIGRATFR